MAAKGGEIEEAVAGNYTAQDGYQPCAHSRISVCLKFQTPVPLESDLLHSHDLKSVKQKAEQIEIFLTGKSNF